MKHGSLFSGIGGFDLAAHWTGWENVFHCEIEEFPRKILNHYWPDAISYEDITTTDFTIHNGNIDILTGGFPCQPYSQAGKRLGKEDERHLWPEMLRAITEIEPRWIVGENVYGIVNWNGGVVFDEVQVDLENEGYSVQPYVLPACGVNAPHQRYRVWFVAHTEGNGGNRAPGKTSGEIRRQNGDETEQSTECGKVWNAPNANSQECNRRGGSGEREGQAREQRRDGVHRTASRPCKERPPANANSNQRPERWVHEARSEAPKRHAGSCNALSYRGGAWKDFPTQSPVCSRDDELSTRLDGITFPKWRNESIKGYGNAVVPHLVMQIFKAIARYES